jgi:hypothetical protein
MAEQHISPVLAMVTVQARSRSQIREVLLRHVLEYSTGSCFCGAYCPADDLWAEHVLDELFREEPAANDADLQPEPSL